jgi:hypothetical protein
MSTPYGRGNSLSARVLLRETRNINFGQRPTRYTARSQAQPQPSVQPSRWWAWWLLAGMVLGQGALWGTVWLLMQAADEVRRYL